MTVLSESAQVVRHAWRSRSVMLEFRDSDFYSDE